MNEGSVKGRYNALRLKHLGINAYRENILYVPMDAVVVHPIFGALHPQR